MYMFTDNSITTNEQAKSGDGGGRGRGGRGRGGGELNSSNISQTLRGTQIT